MHLKFLHSSFSFVAGSVSQHLLSGPLPSSHDWSKVWQAAMQIYTSNTVPMIQKAIAESIISFSWLCKIDSHSGKINFLFLVQVFYILWCNILQLVPAILMHLEFLHSSFSLVAGSVLQHLPSGPLPSSHEWSRVRHATMQIYIANTNDRKGYCRDYRVIFHAHLSKWPSDLKINGTQENISFSGPVFHDLSYGVFLFVASVSFKTTLWMAWIFQQSIRCFYFMFFKANTYIKKEDTMWKAMKSCAINIEVTWMLKFLSKIFWSHGTKCWFFWP